MPGKLQTKTSFNKLKNNYVNSKSDNIIKHTLSTLAKLIDKLSSSKNHIHGFIIRIIGSVKIVVGILTYSSVYIPTWFAPLSYLIVGSGVILILTSSMPFTLSRTTKYCSKKVRSSRMKILLKNFSQDSNYIFKGLLKIGAGVCGAPLGIGFCGAINLLTGENLKDRGIAREFGYGWLHLIKSGIVSFKKIGSRNLDDKHKK